MNDSKKYKLYALSGFFGALMFMTGDCLIYCKAGLTNTYFEPLWAEMSEQRFIISAVLGFIGMSLMLYIMKAFDIIVQDQWLVMTAGYFKKLFPETAECEGWKNRGFNNKAQIVRIIA